MTQLYIIKKAISQQRTNIDMSVPIAVMQAKLNNPISIPTSPAELNQALRAAQKLRREVLAKGKELRQFFKQDRIKALQLASPKKPPDLIEKSFHGVQASKELFKKVPSARPRNSGGISMIKVPIDPNADPKDSSTIFKSIVDPVEIEKQILQRNRNHFSQASCTPMAQPVVTDLLGFSGTTSTADLLLKGTIDVHSVTTDTYGQDILRFCKPHTPPI
jgi:hypothetical protein